MNQSLKRTAMHSSLSVPVSSSTTATSMITLSMIMKYEYNNITDNATTNQSFSTKDYTEERLFQAVYLGYLWTALIIGLPGNAIIAVVYVVIRQKRTSDWFIFFLSVYDCAVCVFAVPLYLSLETGAWVDSGSDLACKIEQFTIFTAQFSSVCMLGIIAVDRYLKICHPTKRSLNATQARNLGFCTPLVSAFVAAPILVWDGNVERRFCRVQEQYKGSLGVKLHLCLTFGFFLCMFFVVIFCYSHVCVVVRRRIKRHRENALKRKHLMQIPAFLQAISNVDDPHGLGHSGGRNKKRFSLFSIGSSRRLSAISPWIKARLSLPSDGCGRKLANPEDETKLASKESLVDIKRQLDYALMFRTKTSAIEDIYRNPKEGISRESREYTGNVGRIDRQDITENLKTFPPTSNDRRQVFSKGESHCNGNTSTSPADNCNNQSQDSVFERHSGSSVSHLADFHADQGYQPSTGNLTMSGSEKCSHCHSHDGNLVVEKNQTPEVCDEVVSRTNYGEQSYSGGAAENLSDYNTTNVSQNVSKETVLNSNDNMQSIPGRTDYSCAKEEITVLKDHLCGVNKVGECASSKDSCQSVNSEFQSHPKTLVHIPGVCSNATSQLIRNDLSNRCSANSEQGRSSIGSLSQSLRSLFTRSWKYHLRPSPSRSKRCRSASSLPSPKHTSLLSRTSVSERGKSFSQSYSDLRRCQTPVTKRDCRRKNCTLKTQSKSSAFEESTHQKKHVCHRLCSKDNMPGKYLKNASSHSPQNGSPGQVAFSPKQIIRQNLRCALVGDLNYTHLPYTKLIDEASVEPCRMSCNTSQQIHVLFGSDDEDYADDNGTKALLDRSKLNRTAVHNSSTLPEYIDQASGSLDEAVDNVSTKTLESISHERRDKNHNQHDPPAHEGCFSDSDDTNHVSVCRKSPLIILNKLKDIPFNKKHSKKRNDGPQTVIEDVKSPDMAARADQIVDKQTQSEPGISPSLGESKSQVADSIQTSGSADNSPDGINSVTWPSKYTQYKNESVLPECTNRVGGTAGEDINTSLQDALDDDMKHDAGTVECGLSVSFDTSHPSELDPDSCNLTSHTDSQHQLQNRFQTSKQECEHSDHNNHDERGNSKSLTSVVTLEMMSECKRVSLEVGLDSNALFKDTEDFRAGDQRLNMENSVGTDLTISTDSACTDREVNSNTRDLTEKLHSLVDLGSEKRAENDCVRCHCGQTDHSGWTMNDDEPESFRGGNKCVALKQTEYNTPMGNSTPENVNVYYDSTSSLIGFGMAVMRRSQSTLQEVDIISRSEASSVDCNNMLPGFTELQAANRSPDNANKNVQKLDPSIKPNNMGLGGCPNYLARDSESVGDFGTFVQPCQTSDKFSTKDGTLVLNEQSYVQYDKAAKSSAEEDVIKHSRFNQPDQSCLCVSCLCVSCLCAASENQQTLYISQQQPSAGTHHQDRIINGSLCQNAITISSYPEQTSEISHPNTSMGTHSRHISERLSAIVDKATEFDFLSYCDECLVVSFIDFLPKSKTSLVEQIIALVKKKRLVNSIRESCPSLSCILQVQNVYFTTSARQRHCNVDINFSSTLQSSTHSSILSQGHGSVWDVSDLMNLKTSPEDISGDVITMKAVDTALPNNPDFCNCPMELDLSEISSLFQSLESSQLIDNHSTSGVCTSLIDNHSRPGVCTSDIDNHSTHGVCTSLIDNADMKSCVTDSTNSILTLARHKEIPWFFSSNFCHFDRCKYFWPSICKSFFRNEICPFCLKPVNFSGFSISSLLHPRRVPLIYSDKGPFEKWLSTTGLDRLSRKSMTEDECQGLVYDVCAQNGGNDILFCSSLEAALPDIADSDLISKRDILKLADQSYGPSEVFKLPTPDWSNSENARITFKKDDEINHSHSSWNANSLNSEYSHTNQLLGNCPTGVVTSALRNDHQASSPSYSEPHHMHGLEYSKLSDENETPYGYIINNKQANSVDEIYFSGEKKMSHCKSTLSCDVPDLNDDTSEAGFVAIAENSQSQSSMKGMPVVYEASECQKDPLEKSKLTSESFVLRPKYNLRQFQLSSSNIVNCALNSLVPLAVGSSKHEVDVSSVHSGAELDNHKDSLITANISCHRHTIPQSIEISSSSNSKSENQEKTTILPATTKTIHSALLGCVPTFQVEDFEVNSSLQDLSHSQPETCQFFVRTVFDTFFTSNSYPFKSDPCLSASDIDYANSELLVFPLSPLFCRTARRKTGNNENSKDIKVYNITDQRRPRLHSAFDIYDARIRKIRSPKRNGPTQSWYSLDDLSSKPTHSRHASMVFLASLRRQLNSVLSPKTIRQFFGMNNPPESKASGKRPPCSRDTLSTNQINVIITRCDSLVMDKRQEMGLPPIRDRAATLDPASLDKSPRSSSDSSISNMVTNTAYENKPKPRASSLDTSYSSNSHSDDPSLLCRSQDLSIGRSRVASLDLLSPTSASYRTGSMCSGISSLSRLTECSGYTEHSRSDCEKITRRTAEREHNITKLLGVITLVFVLSWSVSWSVILMENLTMFPVTDLLATNVTLSIARNLFLVNHFCNILVYMVLSRSFRDKMSECFTSCTSCCRV